MSLDNAYYALCFISFSLFFVYLHLYSSPITSTSGRDPLLPEGLGLFSHFRPRRCSSSRTNLILPLSRSSCWSFCSVTMTPRQLKSGSSSSPTSSGRSRVNSPATSPRTLPVPTPDPPDPPPAHHAPSSRICNLMGLVTVQLPLTAPIRREVGRAVLRDLIAPSTRIRPKSGCAPVWSLRGVAALPSGGGARKGSSSRLSLTQEAVSC